MQPTMNSSYGPGLRHAATALRSRAERAATVANQMDGLLSSMTYAGPAADRFRSTVIDIRDKLVRVRTILMETAEQCQRTAAELDAEAARAFGSTP